MKKTKKKRIQKDKLSADLHAVLGRLFAASDDFMIAVGHVICQRRDGSSRFVTDLIEKALQHRTDINLLYAYLDPEHYKKEDA